MKSYNGVEVYFHAFLVSSQVGVEWLASRLAALPLRKEYLPPYSLASRLEGPKRFYGYSTEESITPSVMPRHVIL
jgi:hypothetical protein